MVNYLNYYESNQRQPPPSCGNLVRLFTTPLLICPCPIDYSKELGWIRSVKYRRGNKIEKRILNRQSENTFVLDRPELGNIRSFIEAKLHDFISNIYASEDKLVITQSWLNRSKKGESHHLHVHPNSIISGVWYPQLNVESPCIHFTKERKKEVSFHSKQFNEFNSETYVPEINEGDLILFPSNLSHSVPLNESDQERISLSFNTWVKGNLGNERTLTYLPLERCV